MVIQKSTVPVLSLAIPVKYVCGCGNPGFAALVPVTYRLKNITGMGSVTGTIRGNTGNVKVWVWELTHT